MLDQIVSDPKSHARWLNTLSYLENCGARLIARSEHPTLVGMEVLKHAAEEFRHAYFFKAAIRRFWPDGFADYRSDNLLGGWSTYHYLAKLNCAISRLLKEQWGLKGMELRSVAYLLVTLAIEERAMEIYPAYQSALERGGISFSIRGIIREEEHHLAEILEMLEEVPNGEVMRARVKTIEKEIYEQWN